MTKTKAIKNLTVGDRISLAEPEGIGEVRAKDKAALLESPGGCWSLDIKIVEGANKGEWLRGQVHSGDSRVAIPA